METKENIFIKFINKIKSLFVKRLPEKNSDSSEVEVQKEQDLEMVIFDLDGTLWHVEETSLISANEYLELNGYDYRITMDDVTSTMGATFAETADRYFPMLETREERDELLGKLLDYNNQKLVEVGGT